jgi:hypothetical protein
VAVGSVGKRKRRRLRPPTVLAFVQGVVDSLLSTAPALSTANLAPPPPAFSGSGSFFLRLRNLDLIAPFLIQLAQFK